jgi:hypothetical protein
LRSSHVRDSSHADYVVHERANDHGGTLREFVSTSDDVVFGVAWSGARVHPDLKALLGSYYGEFKTAAESTLRQPGQRHYGVTKTERIVVETWGHMGNLQGRAYLPALAPQGISVGEIK